MTVRFYIIVRLYVTCIILRGCKTGLEIRDCMILGDRKILRVCDFHVDVRRATNYVIVRFYVIVRVYPSVRFYVSVFFT